MKHRIFTALLASLIALSPMSANAQESKIENWNPKQETICLSETRSNKLAYGYISNIYPSDDSSNPVDELECQVLMEDGSFEEYLAYSYGDDWIIGDTVLLIINDKGTPDVADDIVRDVIYISPISN